MAIEIIQTVWTVSFPRKTNGQQRRPDIFFFRAADGNSWPGKLLFRRRALGAGESSSRAPLSAVFSFNGDGEIIQTVRAVCNFHDKMTISIVQSDTDKYRSVNDIRNKNVSKNTIKRWYFTTITGQSRKQWIGQLLNIREKNVHLQTYGPTIGRSIILQLLNSAYLLFLQGTLETTLQKHPHSLNSFIICHSNHRLIVHPFFWCPAGLDAFSSVGLIWNSLPKGHWRNRAWSPGH